MNYLETLKNIAKNKERRVENIVFLVILLVVLLISINYLFSSDDKKKESNEASGNNTSTSLNINNNEESLQTSTTSLEKKLEQVISQIAGISDVSVLITYSQDSKQNIAYNEKEQEKNGEKTSEKSVAYNEDGSKKTAIVETIEAPKVEGAIVVAKGADSVEMRSKIANAIATVTNVAVYKVQVFEKNG